MSFLKDLHTFSYNLLLCHFYEFLTCPKRPEDGFELVQLLLKEETVHWQKDAKSFWQWTKSCELQNRKGRNYLKIL